MIPEEAVFRVDHFLAMTTVQNVLGTRLANRVLEPIWNGAHIAEIDIVWDETLALEGRAGYYDGVGALKDMLQNHLLQLLCLVAMEPPISLDARDLRDRKVDVLRSIRPLSDDDVVRHTHRARYTSGLIDGVSVPAYVDEDGVDPAHRTETFAELELRRTTGAGTGRCSDSVPARRSAGTGRRWPCISGRCRTCHAACTATHNPTCCGSGTSRRASSSRCPASAPARTRSSR